MTNIFPCIIFISFKLLLIIIIIWGGDTFWNEKKVGFDKKLAVVPMCGHNSDDKKNAGSPTPNRLNRDNLILSYTFNCYSLQRKASADSGS